MLRVLNSLLKRQFDIAPGAPGRGLSTVFFYLFDQVDFLLGAWLVTWPWVSPTLPRSCGQSSSSWSSTSSSAALALFLACGLQPGRVAV
jgi:hypothetical protein